MKLFIFKARGSVTENVNCMSSATENIMMKVPQKIPIYTFSATLAYNGIFIIIFVRAPALECIFRGTGSSDIF